MRRSHRDGATHHAVGTTDCGWGLARVNGKPRVGWARARCASQHREKCGRGFGGHMLGSWLPGGAASSMGLEDRPVIPSRYPRPLFPPNWARARARAHPHPQFLAPRPPFVPRPSPSPAIRCSQSPEPYGWYAGSMNHWYAVRSKRAWRELMAAGRAKVSRTSPHATRVARGLRIEWAWVRGGACARGECCTCACMGVGARARHGTDHRRPEAA